jgi:hypothetical protein
MPASPRPAPWPLLLVLSLPTVKTHVGRMLMKLGLRDRVQAVVFAYEAGVVRTGEAPVSSG